MASLPSLQASLEVATGPGGVIEGRRVKRFVDLSTVGSHMAVRIHDLLAKRNIVQLDCPVSGGVGGAEKGTLAVMVSGPKTFRPNVTLQELLKSMRDHNIQTNSLVTTAEGRLLGVISRADAEATFAHEDTVEAAR